MKQELAAKAAKAKSDKWLASGIVVKVMSKALKEHGYYKMKARIIADRPVCHDLKAGGAVYLLLTCKLRSSSPAPPQGEVLRVDGGGYVGEISMLDSGDVVRVDQQELETVIPSPGGGILVSSLIYGVS